MPAASITPARGTLLRLSDEGEEAAVPKSVLRPLLALNVVYLVLLVTLGPHYGWTVMILVGAVVSAVNLLVVRAASAPPRR
jgi:hypothetical protein